MRRIFTVAAIMCFSALATGIIGCKSSGSSNNTTGNTPTGPGPGSYAGTFEGKVCGRDLTMTIVQNALNLSGNYRLSDPDFGEPMSGTVTSDLPPADAVLNAGADRRFELTFQSYDSFTGGFYKGNRRVCEVTAGRT